MYEQKIAALFSIRPEQVKATIELLDEGNTIPFIARYRKEMTLNLDELLIRQISETVVKFRAVDERRSTILKSIQEQGKLTPDLQKAIETAESMNQLEDLYAPYKQKRKTRASIARERGLEPLAEKILAQSPQANPLKEASTFINVDVPTAEDALQGARDIVAENISDHAEIRGSLREKAKQWGLILSKRIEGSPDEKAVYETYYEFNTMVKNLKPYQILALNRGEEEKVLRVRIEISERDWQEIVTHYYRPSRNSAWAEHLQLALVDSAERLLLPAIERDIRREMTEYAEDHAIQVFAENLRGLLNQPPILERVVMGVDPAYRTGCKIAIIDPSGKLLHTATIYPHEPQRQYKDSLMSLAQWVQKYKVSLIAIGNGTASRETEALVAELTRAMTNVKYLIVNEAGASVYSASDLARAELPDLDVSIRGAVSIARRVQDPLAELVKIDPKSIGVGLYQHDVNQKELGNALDAVVESVVNQVGVDVNTASPALLQHVAGIGAKLAQNIIQYRNENGTFESRTGIKKVSGMGAKAFEQSAGFLRIRGGKNSLDASAIHPESYDIAKEILSRLKLKANSSLQDYEAAIKPLQKPATLKALAQELKVGELTLADILEQLLRPGRDPRADLPAPLLRSDVLNMESLKEGMQLNGTVRNVVDFGAFVDIGVKQDGLLHVSKIPRGTSLKVGDIIKVIILGVDKQKGRISLDFKQ
jgi:protein Tex